MKKYLFVYGTLMDEFAPPEIAETVRKFEYVGNGFVYGRLYDLGEYPGAILDNKTESKIFGRVYQFVPDLSILQKLDDYEGFSPHQSSSNLFVRKEIPITLKDGRKINGWIYEYNRSVEPSTLIKSGDYSELAA